MRHFQVLFSGEVVAGADPNVVRRNLARALLVDERKLEQMFSGRTVVLKSQLLQHEAESLQAQMADLGALMRIKDSSPREKDSPFALDDKSRDGARDRTLQDLTAAHISCPRCGHMQLDAEFCARCGIDIRATLREQRKQDLIIEKKIRELRAKRPAAGASAAGPAIRTADSRRSTGNDESPAIAPVGDDPLRTETRVNPFSAGRGLKRLFRKKVD